MGNSEPLADPMELRSPLYPPVAVLFSICKGLPCYPVWLPLRVAPVTPEVHLSVTVVFVKVDASVFPFVGQGRQLHSFFIEATSGFARATTRRFAQLPFGAFVKKLSASGYPLHLLQATWVNYLIPTTEL